MSTDNHPDHVDEIGDLDDLIAELRDSGADPDACEIALWQEGVTNRISDVARVLFDKAGDTNPEPCPTVLLRALAGSMSMALFEAVDAQAIKNTTAGRVDVHMGILGQFLRMYIAVADNTVARENPSHGTATRH